MKKTLKHILLTSGLLAVAMLQGCASSSIKATATQNPAPKEAFSAYGRIELKPVVFKAGVTGDASGLSKINQNLKSSLDGKLAGWNEGAANGRGLLIEPVIEEMRFIHGAKRVFLGPLAGSSGVLMRLNIRDTKGAVVATPEFFQRADAMAAGFTFGVHDNLMLDRVSKLASDYVVANYARAVGGSSGADDKAVNAK